MKKKGIFLGILVFVVALLLSGCGQQANNIVKVAMEVQNEPYAFQKIVEMQSPNNVGDGVLSTSDRVKIGYTGFEVELIQAIAAKTDMRIELIPMPWINILNSVQSGECSIGIGDLSITEERSKVVSFSQPYIIDSHAVAVVKESNDINTLADLDGKLIGVELGTTFPVKVMQLKSAKVRGYLGTAELSRDFFNGNINVMLMDAYQFRYWQKNNRHLNDKAIIIADNESVAMAISKDKPELLKKVNKALAEMEATGELTALKQKWFGVVQK